MQVDLVIDAMPVLIVNSGGRGYDLPEDLVNAWERGVDLLDRAEKDIQDYLVASGQRVPAGL